MDRLERKSPTLRAFNLSRWFAAVGLLSIAVLSVASGVLLSRLFTDRMLEQEGVLTMQFMQSILEVERAPAYFQDSDRVEGAKVEELLQHLSTLPDVLRVNLYSRRHRILWSSDRSLVGKSFPDNAELDAALSGRVEVESGPTRDGETAKAEHENLPRAGQYFVEIYLPVWDDTTQRVVGAVELYRTPRRLFEAIRAGQWIVWIGALVAGALLYVALFSLVRRADNLIRAQQDRLVEAETLAAVGEMGSAVAHGIRNPLAAIRSSAELVQESDQQPTRDASADIIAEVDRLEQWVRELLTYSRPLTGKLERVSLPALVAEHMAHFAKEMERRGIAGHADLPDDLPLVRGDALLLGQVIHSLVSNALEATQRGGCVAVTGGVAPGRGQLALRIEDNGPGMSSEQLQQAFKPFYTTKPHGIGIGLPLAKRIVERMGGRISIASRPGAGTTIKLLLPTA